MLNILNFFGKVQRGQYLIEVCLGESPKRTISDRGVLGLLQIVSEPNTERCANEDVGGLRGWIVRFYFS